MWPFSRRTQENPGGLNPEILNALQALANERDKGKLLNECETDVERRSLCLQWAGRMRDLFYAGRRQAIKDMLLSRDLRYKHMNARTRTVIANIKWAQSQQCREIIDLEQTYARWAMMYSGGPGAR